MSRNHSSREWSWILGPDGSPIYKAPLHGIHNSLFAFSCRCAEEDFNQSETEAFIRQGIERFGARRPVGTFWYFSKSDSKSGTVHAGVDAVEQARTFAGSSAAMLQEFESWLYPKI